MDIQGLFPYYKQYWNKYRFVNISLNTDAFNFVV